MSNDIRCRLKEMQERIDRARQCCKLENGGKPLSEKIADAATASAGTTKAFLIAASAIIIWLACGPTFGFSDTWQLLVNTSTTIITFLMLFLIQRAQNKDVLAIHTKLNEIVLALRAARNDVINIEAAPEAKIQELHERCKDDTSPADDVE